jgi:putative transposase
MKKYPSLFHTRGIAGNHVVFIPKRRKKQIFGALKRHLGELFHELVGHKDSKIIVEGHLMGDHVHMCISVPPKYAVLNVVGYAKGKSAIQITRPFGGRQWSVTGENIWARGYFVSTVGLDETMVRAYIRRQEQEDERAMTNRLLIFSILEAASIRGMARITHA